MLVDGDVELGLALGPHTCGLGGGLFSVHGGLGLGTNGRFGTRLGLALRLCFAVGIASLGSTSSEGEAVAFLAELSGIFLQSTSSFFSCVPPVHENNA